MCRAVQPSHRKAFLGRPTFFGRKGGIFLYDIIIIGAGVTGCAVARYLSRYEGRMLVLEKAEDVC